jgi:hypothetical protein
MGPGPSTAVWASGDYAAVGSGTHPIAKDSSTTDLLSAVGETWDESRVREAERR